ncbi:uncharacterized protein LOC127257212 [Andrographis paniculata]|uniref:uncharacterized protein LOC127257212 n=1 Tax=Andrographis paniculata TaxID=175694 RepID=UPI0021E85E05|nr:uncharacterized protein LOC127257212 [Andrographis paniculata]
MAASSQTRFRSISLPSRLQHPTGFESHLQNLKSWQVPKAAPISSDAIQSGLLELSELYNQFKTQQQKLSLHRDGKSVQDSLSTSIELLDSCATIRESVQMIREAIQSLQSALRRKGLDSSIHPDTASYLTIRKKMNKSISKTMKSLKKLENKNGLEELTQVNLITVSIFKGILVFLSWPTTWNLVSKLISTKDHHHHHLYSDVTEVGCVDSAVNTLHGRVRNSNDSKNFDLQMMQTKLQNLDACAEGIESGIETVFRNLIECRVTLLNIVTDH